MDQAARGTLPPFPAIRLDMTAASDAALMLAVERAYREDTPPPREPLPQTCDLSTTCPCCDTEMQPEHAHYRCGKCGYRDSCCF